MEPRVTKPALVVDHLVLRTATEEAEIDHHTAKAHAALCLLKTPPPQIN